MSPRLLLNHQPRLTACRFLCIHAYLCVHMHAMSNSKPTPRLVCSDYYSLACNIVNPYVHSPTSHAADSLLLQAASPVMASELPTAAVVNPTAEVAISSKTDVEGVGAKINKFFNKVYVDPTSKINEDPFGECISFQLSQRVCKHMHAVASSLVNSCFSYASAWV